MNLNELVAKGRFRRDLFYRLNTVTIEIPPLRERKIDIPPLAKTFLEKFNKKFFTCVKGFTRHSIQSLIDYDWPGNVRELKHVVERTVLLAEGEVIDADLLPKEILNMNNYSDGLNGFLKEKIANFEKQLIQETLTEYQGNKSATAKTLGISRRGLWLKMRRYGLI